MKDRVEVATSPDLIGQTITVAGWVATRRDHGKLIFIDLRDRSGLLQIVFHQPSEPEAYAVAEKLRSEFVVKITGEVKIRAENAINSDLPTGTVELKATTVEILNESETPPFEIDGPTQAGEEARMTYRYLDLRSHRLKHNLELRHKAVKFIRNFLDTEGFWEIETPYLTKGTPEGAREFVVPSRLAKGKYFTLPQSPQQFKQLLMVAGVEKYFQIARCFRDEDPRADRTIGEHTQLDLEMSFVERDDILRLIEKLFSVMAGELFPEKHSNSTPWPVLTYAEAIEKYGTDKPDLRTDKEDPNEFAFCFVVDFPMFSQNKAGEITSEHHPFCMPHPDDVDLIETDPLKVRANSYDFILNGFELASGSIRIHQADLQRRVFKALGLDEQTIEERFGHMLLAFRYGAPPHGGIAPGVDRFLMVMAGESSVREMIAFPKSGDGRDLMMGAPSEIDPALLKELGLPTGKKEEEKN